MSTDLHRRQRRLQADDDQLWVLAVEQVPQGLYVVTVVYQDA